jgi:hypothetical protein
MPVTKGGGFNITSIEPIDNRFTINNSSDRLGFTLGRTFEGLTTYASSSQEYWILSDKDNYDNKDGWATIYISNPGGEDLTVTGSTSLSGSLILTGGADFRTLTTESFGARFTGFASRTRNNILFEFQTSVSGTNISNFAVYDDWGVIISSSLSDKTYKFYSTGSTATLPEDDWENGIFYFNRNILAAADLNNGEFKDKLESIISSIEPQYKLGDLIVTKSTVDNADRGMGASISISKTWKPDSYEIFVGALTQSITESIGTSSGETSPYYSISSSGDLNIKQVVSTRLIAEDAYITASYFLYQAPANPAFGNTNYINFQTNNF